MPACLCAHNKMQYSGRAENFCRSLTTGVVDVCEPPCGFLSTELSLSAKAVFLMTETSLQLCLLLLMDQKHPPFRNSFFPVNLLFIYPCM